MILLRELTEEIEILNEDDDGGKKSLYIQGIFLQSVPNKNGRIYPEGILDEEVSRYLKEEVSRKKAVGELNHPANGRPGIDLERASHKFVSLEKSGGNYIGKAKIMESMPMGKVAAALIAEDVLIGVSSRGVGNLVKNSKGLMEVQKGFRLSTAGDIVANPSAPDAFVQGIMEEREWIYESGIWKEADLVNAKRQLMESHRIDLEEKKLRIFEEFMLKINK